MYLAAASLFYTTLFLHAKALRTIRTIDDEAGDSVTGVKPVYLDDAQRWHQGATCAECVQRPDPKFAFRQTWHDASRNPEPPALGVQFSFTGTSLSVYCILPNVLITNVATSTILTFSLDSKPIGGKFAHTPSSTASTSPFLYNVSVFTIDGLENTQHTFVMSDVSATTAPNIILFDYAAYVFDDGTESVSTSSHASEVSTEASPSITDTTTSRSVPSTSTSSTSPSPSIIHTTPSPNDTSALISPSPSQSSTTVPTLPGPSQSANSSSKHITNTAAIIGASISGLLILLIAASTWWYLRRRHHSRNSKLHNSPAIIVPFEEAPSSLSPESPNSASRVARTSLVGTGEKGTAISTNASPDEAPMPLANPGLSMRQLQEAVQTLQAQQERLMSEIRAPPMYSSH